MEVIVARKGPAPDQTADSGIMINETSPDSLSSPNALSQAFIQSGDDRVGLLAAGLFLHERGTDAPSPKDVSAFRFRAERMLQAEPAPDMTGATRLDAQTQPRSFWSGGDAQMGKARLKAALSLLGLVIVMAILFRMAGGFLFAPSK
jgi:hypothetical protein